VKDLIRLKKCFWTGRAKSWLMKSRDKARRQTMMIDKEIYRFNTIYTESIIFKFAKEVINIYNLFIYYL